jgi:uncharacterized protein YecE (DUF72 family)
MIRLGTSGFSYDDWIGEVYPKELPRWQWLSYYAEVFDTVELNVTYYRIPDRKLVRGWIDRTPDGFLFSVKAHKSLTHERESPDFHAFSDPVAELQEAGKLACILAQFPHSFHPTSQNWNYLGILAEGLSGFPVVVEFRGADWIEESTFMQLDELGLGFCCVDEPSLPRLMPKVARATSEIAYVRFHGRNAEKWWRHEHAWERYDYTYSEAELEEWVPKIRTLDDRAILTVVYANNHYRGQSVDTINKLQPLLLPQD